MTFRLTPSNCRNKAIKCIQGAYIVTNRTDKLDK